MIKINNFGDGKLFYSDSAFRFRYAEMIAKGKKVPILDNKVHHPEGLKVRSLIHLTEDWVIGQSYRIFIKVFPQVSFINYLKYFVSIFSSLSVIIVFLLSSSFWGNKTSGFLSALFYAIGIPSFWRVTGNYLREEFALPFLFLSLYFFFRAIAEKRSPFLIFFSGLSLTIGLITWHLSQFFFSLFAFFFIILFLLEKDGNSPYLFKNFYLFLLPLLLAGLFWEPLASKYFLLSFPMVVSFWLWIISLFGWRRFRLLALLPIPIFLFANFLLPKYFQEYAHVFETIIAKVIHLGKKPTDPSSLSFSARSIWMGPFSSPGLLSFAFAILIPFILALWGFLPFLGKRGKLQNIKVIYLSFFLIIFTLLYLLVIRLEVFLFFFLVIAIGGNWFLFTKKRLLFFFLLIPALFLEGNKVINYAKLFNRYYLKLSAEWKTKPTAYGRDWESLSEWIKKNVKEDEGILADVDISAMLLAYTEKPIVIQPIYEKKEARDRVFECLSGLFQTEEQFLSLIDKYRISYIVYEKDFLLDNTQEGVRYLTDNLKVKKDAVAYLMHFQPEALKNLSLVWQTNTFRVYRVLRTGKKEGLPKLPYSPYFDRSLFRQERDSPYWDDQSTKEVEEKVFNALLNYNWAVALMKKKEYQKAIEKFLAILEWFPELERTNYYLGVCYEETGEKIKAFAYFERAIENNPTDIAPYLKKVQILDSANDLEKAVEVVASALKIEPENRDLYSLFGYLYLKRNLVDSAIKRLNGLSSLLPKNPFIFLYTGYLYAYKNDLTNAEREFLLAKEADSTNFEIHSALGSLYLQKGEKDKAVFFYQRSLQLNPNQLELKKKLDDLLKR